MAALKSVNCFVVGCAANRQATVCKVLLKRFALALKLRIQQAKLAVVDVLLDAAAELRKVGWQTSKASGVDAALVVWSYIHACYPIRQIG